MEAKGHTRAVETEETWMSSGPPPSGNTLMVGVEREEEAHKVDVRTKARGETE